MLGTDQTVYTYLIPHPLSAIPPDGLITSEGCDVLYQCPYRGLDGCNNGIGGRGLLRGSLFNHLKNQHYRREEGKNRCRERLRSNGDVYMDWDSVLLHLKSWLCSQCMHINAWGKKCKLHQGYVVSALVTVVGVEALSSSSAFTVAGTDKPNEVVLPAVSLELLHTVFQTDIPTVSSIPSKCRLHFARTFKVVLQKVVASPKELVPWIQLLLFPVCILHMYIPESSQEDKASTKKKMQIRSINLALNQWEEVNGYMRLIHNVLDEHRNIQKLQEEVKKKKTHPVSQEATNLRLCIGKLRKGLYAVAIRTLTSSGIAPNNEGTLNELRSKHPSAAPPQIPSIPIAQEAMTASADLVLGRLRSFPKGTSCGRDGLRAHHLLDAISGSAAAISEEVLAAITEVVNLWLSGMCPPILGEFVESAPLTPLIKPGGGLRHISVGTIWRRLVSKCAATHVGKEVNAYLGDYQFGVGAKCGGEAILHDVNRMIEEKGDSNNLSMLLVDFSNAFNLIDRSF